MTHVPFSGYVGSEKKGDLGQTLTDEFLLVRKVEKFGLTSFPKWLMDNDFVEHAMNVELVAAASKEKEFWQSELQSGGELWGCVAERSLRRKKSASGTGLRLRRAQRASCTGSGVRSLLAWKLRVSASPH
jgi:hypothetical protein